MVLIDIKHQAPFLQTFTRQTCTEQRGLCQEHKAELRETGQGPRSRGASLLIGGD